MKCQFCNQKLKQNNRKWPDNKIHIKCGKEILNNIK